MVSSIFMYSQGHLNSDNNIVQQINKELGVAKT